jgi:hypothetical protein
VRFLELAICVTLLATISLAPLPLHAADAASLADKAASAETPAATPAAPAAASEGSATPEAGHIAAREVSSTLGSVGFFVLGIISGILVLVADTSIPTGVKFISWVAGALCIAGVFNRGNSLDVCLAIVGVVSVFILSDLVTFIAARFK